MKLSKIIVPALLAVLTATVMVAKPSGSRVIEPDRRKADYIFLEAQRYRADSRNDGYTDLITRAYQLNPDDPTIGFYYGLIVIGLSDGDSTAVDFGSRLMNRYLAKNPDDYSNALIYAGIAARTGDKDEVVRVWSDLCRNNPERQEFAYQYASILASRGDTASVRAAIAVLDSMGRGEKELGLMSKKIQLLYQLDDTVAMLNDLDALLQTPPPSIDKIIFAGDVYDALQMPDSALKYYNRACEMDSTSGLAYYSRAEFFRNAGDSVAYDREIFNALNSNNLELEVKTELMRNYVANLYGDSTQHQRLDSLFNHLVALHPHQVPVHALYSTYLMSTGRLTDAAEQQSYCLDLEPNDRKGWLRLQALYLLSGKVEDGIRAGERGLHYFPDDPELLIGTASYLGQLERVDSAMIYFNHALKTIPATNTQDRCMALTGIADVYYRVHNVDSALVYYEKAVEVDNSNPMTLNNYAYCLAENDRDLDKALKMIQRANLERPDDVNSLDTYAWVLFKLKRYPEARDMIDRTIEHSNPLTVDALDHAGDIYFMNGERDAAIGYWKQALELAPDNELIARKVKEGTIFFK